MASTLLDVLQVVKVATLLRESDEVGENHSTQADVIKRLDGTDLDAFVVVIVHSPFDRILHVLHAQHRFRLRRHVLQLHSLHGHLHSQGR